MNIDLVEEKYQILNPAGDLVRPRPEDLTDDNVVDFYRWMVYGRVYSNRLVALQRQGRMGTFAPMNGQEAANVGIATSLEKDDWLIGSYRESLAYMVKGVPPVQLMRTWRGHLGVQYPPESHCLPFQIVLGTQMLHGVGVAMGMKYEKKPNVVVAGCGDGATSEGDFNEALNFASVYKAPIVFVVQNNGWAISVPREQQTAAKYIAHRAPGFGMPGYLVDGNDLFAMHQVVSECIERAKAGEGPSLIEAVTYRLGMHTTADDPTKYRSNDELEHWRQRDPIIRMRNYLLKNEILSDLDEEQLHEEVEARFDQEIEELELTPTDEPSRMFDLVYATPTPQLERQRQDLLASLV